ncbi:hypothetical protein HUJ05_012569 [Dendroctonus ponderosae]|nr:hypothetical protein HUJ05_012569 [Dendroctonus ponderosae]
MEPLEWPVKMKRLGREPMRLEPSHSCTQNALTVLPSTALITQTLKKQLDSLRPQNALLTSFHCSPALQTTDQHRAPLSEQTPKIGNVWNSPNLFVILLPKWPAVVANDAGGSLTIGGSSSSNIVLDCLQGNDFKRGLWRRSGLRIQHPSEAAPKTERDGLVRLVDSTEANERFLNYLLVFGVSSVTSKSLSFIRSGNFCISTNKGRTKTNATSLEDILTDVVDAAVVAAQQQNGSSSVEGSNWHHVLSLPMLGHCMPYAQLPRRGQCYQLAADKKQIFHPHHQIKCA